MQNNQRGFTLMELMVSLAIVAGVVTMVCYVLTAAQAFSNETRQRLLAANAARSTLEAVKNTPLDNVLAINTAPLVPVGLNNGAIAIRTNPANPVGQQLATVTVTVTWLGERNRAGQLEVTTLRSRF